MIFLFIMGLFASIGIFFLPTFHNLLNENPTLGTGLVAILSAISAGFIGAISNLIQASHAKQIASNQFKHQRSERRNERAYAIIDEKYIVIIQGANRMAEEFEQLRVAIQKMISFYSPHRTAEQLRSLITIPFENFPQAGIIKAEVASLNDGEINKYWEAMSSTWGDLLKIYQKIRDALEHISNNPDQPRPALEVFYSDEDYTNVRTAFIEHGGRFRRRLTELRIAETESPEVV